MTFNKSLWSRKHEQWNTPRQVYQKLDGGFHFQLDAASNENNPMKAPKFYTEIDNGLIKPWLPSTFFNPPFTVEKVEGQKKIRTNVLPLWVSKAQEEAERGNYSVGLLGSRTGSGWAQKVCFPYAKMVCFVEGRLHFNEAKNSAPFDSVLFMFADREPTRVEFEAFKQFAPNATFLIEKEKLVAPV